MKITDRMCNVVWKTMCTRYHGIALGVFKEHTQPITYSDCSVPGYYTLSIAYHDYVKLFRRWDNGYKDLRSDTNHGIGSTICVTYSPEDMESASQYSDFLRSFVVRAVTLARNYRTHEIDHVVLTLSEKGATEETGE